MLTQEGCRTRSETCLNASLSATNPTLAGLIVQEELSGELPETRRHQFLF